VRLARHCCSGPASPRPQAISLGLSAHAGGGAAIPGLRSSHPDIRGLAGARAGSGPHKEDSQTDCCEFTGPGSDLGRGWQLPGRMSFRHHWYRPDPAGFGARAHTGFGEVSRQLDEYFAGQREHFDLPVDVQGNEFQRRTWDLVGRIPLWQTASYGELARTLRDDLLTKDAAAAVAWNPLCVIVPQSPGGRQGRAADWLCGRAGAQEVRAISVKTAEFHLGKHLRQARHRIPQQPHHPHCHPAVSPGRKPRAVTRGRP
jgi:hypothetical protein